MIARRVLVPSVALALAMVALPAAGAHAATATTTFTASADSYVSSKFPTKNFGSSMKLQADASPVNTSYVRFSVGGLSGSIVKATLLVHASNASSTGIDARGVSDTGWTEGGITFNNAPAPSAIVAGSSGPFSSGAWVSVDVSSLAGGTGPISMAVTTSSTAVINIGSRETSTPPQLQITTVVASDTSPPSIPGNLSATAVSAWQIDLSWSASTDDTGVTGYTVYRNDGFTSTVGGSTIRYADTGVAPSTTYSYTVDAFDAAGNHSGRSSFASATTPAASDPVIAAAGDIACDPSTQYFNGGAGDATHCREQATSDLLTTPNLAAVLTLGDTQYECGGYQAFLQSYDPTWGRLKAITHPVLGNHEYQTTANTTGGTDCSITADASGYFNYFGSAAGSRGSGYYSFDVGSWHIIALNAECSFVACGPGSAQDVWLRGDLAAHPASCTLAFWHQPRWSSGLSGNNSTYDQFWRDLYNAHADLVLDGHDHIYERFAPQNPSELADPNGIREFTVGTGGKSHSSVSTIQPNSEVRNVDTFGVLELTLHANGYDWRFVPEAGGTFTDSGTTPCR